MRNTLRSLSWLWIFTLFLSPIVGLISILMLFCVEIGTSIDWEASFTGKSMN